MPNALHTDKYELHAQERMPLFCDENRTDTKVMEIKGNAKEYRLCVHHCSGKIGEYHYNSENNVIAVEGCYWACPYSVQLFSFENPMNENPKFVDIISCLDGDYDVYDELVFSKWEDGNLHLKAYLAENLPAVELVIPKETYLT